MLRSFASSAGASTHLIRTHHSLHRLVTPRSRSLALASGRHLTTTLVKPTTKPQSFQSHRLSNTARSLFKRSFATPVSRQISPIKLPIEPIMESPYPPCPPIPKANGPVDLILPPTEDRKHKYFTLSNGLEVVVVSDPKADKAAASMDVGVGHLSDPDDLPGCAHFCEHLLFMGTKTHPSENAYQQYLSSHNGHSNAWTAMTSTNYYFDVSPDALKGALDRFSGFFSEPLFNEDCTEREIKAVDSEHKKNLQNDVWRFYQLEKHLSKPGHPYGKFGTGNYESLWSVPKEAGRDPRRQLIEWWEKEYCARRMKLAVAGKEDVDTLEKWVREKFENVPVRTEGKPEVGRDGVRVVFDESPYGKEQLGYFTFTKPVRDMRALELMFPFPDMDHLYKTRPTHFISHFLGHEGRGSILSYLKKKGWVNSLSAGNYHDAAGFSLFKISVDLTPDGLEHYQDVALTVFKYISLLRSQPPSVDAFNEIKAIADISFRFAERGRTSSYCTNLSSWLQSPVPREKIVSSKWLVEEYNRQELEWALQLLDPRRADIGVTSKVLPKNVVGEYENKEPIYGTEYKRVKFDEEFLKEAISGAPIADLQLPGPNLFIPEKLDVRKFDVQEPAKRPVILKDTSLSRLWYKRDDRFWLPKANLDVMLHSPILNVTPRNAVLSRLFCDLFSDSITEDVYDADLAELSFNLWNTSHWIQISAGGFSDKLAVLTEKMLEKFVNYKVDEARFQEVAEATRLHWKNFGMSDPWKIGRFYNSYATQEIAWTQEEKLKELEYITAADVQAFGKELLTRLHIETLIHGNTSPEGAKEIQDMLERVLKPRELTPTELKAPRSLVLPSSSEYVWQIPVPNESEVNGSVIYEIHVGDPSDITLRNHLSLFSQIAAEPCFDILRTKQQLGYIVSGHASQTTGTMGYTVLVQSERDPVYVETRIEAFLDGLKEIIEEMSEEEFEKHKQSLISKKEEKPKNLAEETKRFWGRIQDRYFEFSRRENDVAELRKTTKQDILNVLMTYIHTSSPTRAKLSVHVKSQYKGIKFDLASAAPLVKSFTEAGIAVDPAAIQKLLSNNPTLEQVKEFANSTIDAAANVADDVKVQLKDVVAELKGQEAGPGAEAGAGPGAEDVKVRPGNVWIEDIQEFKARLVPSKAAVPVEPLKTLVAEL
ncbi:insulysin [Cryptococcus neoformans Gb118]|nr:insulysin [Cryptococcus neoformans var. grubii MW-RSA36]OXL09364.1 insulysin [Cryptococcus neoformans var. grubii Gb118]